MPDFFGVFGPKDVESDIIKEQEKLESNQRDLKLAGLRNANWKLKLLKKRLESRLGSDFPSTYQVSPTNKDEMETLADMMGVNHKDL